MWGAVNYVGISMNQWEFIQKIARLQNQATAINLSRIHGMYDMEEELTKLIRNCEECLYYLRRLKLTEE